ncbi:hypothetical protein BWQ96_05166 [Gracilariopsis chorda]|uniref:Uncharacterized protein n=1 Tax=Gracilariopsis chorda TaxID=448386 RepID=A0A2V3ISI3_9FLOR|nr:hypothetical protein BWQ96_05166 [Gracilariopsis chorda]|eukprot:PXF45064.1 hypothetical protein BWQ96_05166 [Gracilariopsis chorda]
MDKIRECQEDLVKEMNLIQIPESQDEMKRDRKPPNIKAIAKSSEPRVILHLEDAVTVLYSLSSAIKQSSSDMTRNDIEAMVQERVHEAILAVGVTSSKKKSSLQRTGPASSGIQKSKQSNNK